MLKPALCADEAGRLAALHAYQILDTPQERAFDDLTLLAARICGTPISVVSLIDADRQWFKSKVGLSAPETARDISFCAHAIHGTDLFVVPDARQDERFADNPFVTEQPHIRFYAGAPLITPSGHALGTLCVIDSVPHHITDDQAHALQALSRQAMSQMQLRRSVAQLTDTLTDLAESERFARSTVDALSAHVAILDQHGKILAVNQAWREFTSRNGGSSNAFAEGSNYLRVCDSASGSCSNEAAAVGEGIRGVMRGERPLFELEYPCHSPTERRWYVVRVSRFTGEGPLRVVVSHENVTQRREAVDKLRHDALHDGLTGLPNRTLFHERVGRCLAQARRDPHYHFAVLFMDLDRFKIVNDSLGHAAGDRLLTTVAQRLRECLRESDTVVSSDTRDDDESDPVVARLGGDEFTVLLDGLRTPGDAARVAQRLLAAVCQPVAFAGHELEITASIGIVAGNADYASEKDVLRDADAAMYKAKEAGKNRFAIFDESLHAAAVARLEMESDLRHAVERNELLLHYQPIVSLQTKKLKGFEALVRWQRNGRLISPGEFIPLAEDIGLIVPIGAWIMQQACRQLADWQSRFPDAASMSMSINLSRRQLIDPDLVPMVNRILKTTGVNPESVILEITESVIMDDQDGARAVLTALKATGVRLSMDDFGTGYSSLSCLHRFPLSELKVDRGFIADLQGKRGAAAVVHAVIGLAHNLGLVVVAEGLEKLEHVAFLQAMDCDYGQGYLFAKPLEAERAQALISSSPDLTMAA
ncbi:MAG TPA: EAL domain-containing protein [Tepidisphaeraceae bacterium]|jgi:diguanylate cyclase (GGDEF)-like protein